MINLPWLFDEIPRERVQDNCLSFEGTSLLQIPELQREPLPVLGKETREGQKDLDFEATSKGFQFPFIQRPQHAIVCHTLGYHFLNPNATQQGRDTCYSFLSIF